MLRFVPIVYGWLFLGPLVGAASGEERPPEVAWGDLLPKTTGQFDDPFAKLSDEQLTQLARVARIRRLLEERKIPADGPSAEEEKRSVTELASQGFDVDWLLSQRERVTRERMKRAGQVDEGLAGTRIRIPGYVLPLFYGDDKKVTEFLLVPWVGACIHTSPPPPNQMIHVAVPGGTDARGPFSPVWLEGTLELKPASYELFLVDGTRRVNVAFTMEAEGVTDYSAAVSDTLARVEIPAEAMAGHSWWQTWQTKVSLLFTKTMSDIRDRRNSGPLFWGLLVAFLYGIIHTLGPGHGKAVVVSYFVGHGGSFRRGVGMGFQIALFHVLSAVVIVWATDFAVRQTTGQAPSDYRFVRLVSYAMIATIGGFMVWRALRDRKAAAHHDHGHSDDHVHDHSDGGSCLACAAHAKNRKGLTGWLALAVGAVPCTGALLVLLFGMAHDLLGPAILLVAAISLGMAVAMSGIGVLAIVSRRAIDRRLEPGRRSNFANSARFAAALVVLFIGGSLFVMTWTH